MRDLFDNPSPEQASEAARRAVRPNLRRRFYKVAAAAPVAGDFVVQLDGKTIHTPARRPLAAPVIAVATAIAAEWQAQHETINPATMPLTRLANAIVDGVTDHADAVAAEVEKYLGSDLVCYRAGRPEGLVERQARAWDPILLWAAETLGAHFTVGQGVVHIVQPATALAAARAKIPGDVWRLGAVHAATTLTGSALIALALADARLTVEEAWQAAHVDEDWNMEQWGRDELALQRRAYRLAEFQAAATVLQSLAQ